jgi:protein-tyrosine phosphatase
MPYSVLNMMLGALMVTQCFVFPSLAIPWMWLGLSFVVLGFAYLLRRPAMLGKRCDGSLAWWSWCAFLPLHLLLHAVWHLTRLLSREATTHQVTHRLTVGRRLLASELPKGIELVIDLTSEFSEPKGIREGLLYRCFPILDAAVPDAAELRAFIAALPDMPTYVHCAQGHGRTGLFSIACLREKGCCRSASEALALLKSVRQGIALNRAQREFIITLYGKEEGLL